MTKISYDPRRASLTVEGITLCLRDTDGRELIGALGERSSFELFQTVNACEHEWVYRPALLSGEVKVDYQCTKCETWRKTPEGPMEQSAEEETKKMTMAHWLALTAVGTCAVGWAATYLLWKAATGWAR